MALRHSPNVRTVTPLRRYEYLAKAGKVQRLTKLMVHVVLGDYLVPNRTGTL